jgi:hypothetical protein
MMLLPGSLNYELAAVYCAQDSNASKHREPTRFDSQNQRLDRCLPFRQRSFILPEAGYVERELKRAESLYPP